MSKFSDLIKNLPNKPGVYRFYSPEDNLLYIGKAKNLKNRVSSYFQEGRPRNQRLTLMISQIDRVEYTEVKSEKESLILEANLIHELQPKYNVLLKDDKSYVYVRFSNRDPIPGIFLVRKKFDTRSDYFGPYTKKYGIENTLRLLRQIFPYCQERFFTGKACQYVGIKQCDGICVGLETKENYIAKLEQIKSILSGKTEVAESFIANKMQEAIGNKNFELAALWRDRLALLKDTIVDQKIILPHPQDLDIITLIVDAPTSDGLVIGSVFVQNIRAGKMINVNNFLLSGTSEEEINSEDKTAKTEESENLQMQFLQRFLSTYYSQNSGDSDVFVQIFDKTPVELVEAASEYHSA